MNVKSEVKIKAKLLGNEVVMTLPVSVDVERALKTQAIAQAEHMNLTDVKILDLETVKESEWVQLEIPFEFQAEDLNEENTPSENSTAQYTPYRSQQTVESSQDCSSDQAYTPYASLKSTQEISQNPNPCYVPMVNDTYVPYSTRIVPIDSSYRNYDF